MSQASGAQIKDHPKDDRFVLLIGRINEIVIGYHNADAGKVNLSELTCKILLVFSILLYIS